MVLVEGALLLILVWFVRRRWRSKECIGFFHPYTNDGGGGERVLWCAVRAIQELFPDVPCAIYTGDDASPSSLKTRALEKFGVELHSPPLVVRLRCRKWVEASTYPKFTLVGQSLGSIVLGLEALLAMKPLLFFDTSGYAFTYPLARLFGCKVACYTHYPTVSSDMVKRVLSRSHMYNNNGAIASSLILSFGKAFYYMVMGFIYGIVGRCAHVAMVNSSWTEAHLVNLWGGSRIVRVYPPCNVESLLELPVDKDDEDFYFISVAQFRPEKNHVLQLEAFAMALKQLGYPDLRGRFPRLKLVGSCRNEEDSERLAGLKDIARGLHIENQVDLCENVSYTVLKKLLGGAQAGIHFMIDEHFGISVVEYMAAGAIPIAHNSAGPKQDIVLPEDGQRTGFLASSVTELAHRMVDVFSMSATERAQIATAARQRSMLFSEKQFDNSFKAALKNLKVRL